MRLKKPVELEAGLKPKKALQFWLGETVVLVLLGRERLQRRGERSPPAALKRWARSSGIWTVTRMSSLYPAFAFRSNRNSGVLKMIKK
jgi:hypothetical protein